MKVDDLSQRRTCATLSNHFQKLTTLTLISFSFIVSPSRKKDKETVHQPALSHHLLSQNSIHQKRKTKWTNKGRKENLSALTYSLWSYLPHNPLHQPPSPNASTTKHLVGINSLLQQQNTNNSRLDTTTGVSSLLYHQALPHNLPPWLAHLSINNLPLSYPNDIKDGHFPTTPCKSKQTQQHNLPTPSIHSSFTTTNPYLHTPPQC